MGMTPEYPGRTGDRTGDRWQGEGRARFRVGEAFYRRETETARDLGVLAAAIYRRERGQLRVLDAMAGCGVRSLRYYLESGADWLWVNEGNPELHEVLRDNLEVTIPGDRYELVHEEANRLFLQCYADRDYYDLLDIDAFGSGAPFISTSLWAARLGGLIYLTSTDGRTISGREREKSLRVYGAYARHHPAVHEQGLRLLLGSLQQQAAAKQFGIEPIFSLFGVQTYRVMVRLVPGERLTEDNYGWLGYCHECGEFRRVSWRTLAGSNCGADGSRLILSGPMWLGALHDRAELEKMAVLAADWGWTSQVELLSVMAQEADLPPYFYKLSEIGRRGGVTELPKRDRAIAYLQERGYRAVKTHIDPEGIKTDAPLSVCIAIARACSPA